MIGLSRFRSAMIRESMVKVAYVSNNSVKELNETGQLHADPGYLGTGCLVESSPGEFSLQVVGVNIDNILIQGDNRRARAYRWALSEEDGSLFVHDQYVNNADERMQTLLDYRYKQGYFPPVSVWVLDDITEQIFNHDDSHEPPHGEYREYQFISILKQPLYNKDDEYLRDEFICLVSDL